MTRRELTNTEREEFIKDNFHGVLSFSGVLCYPSGILLQKRYLYPGAYKAGKENRLSQKEP